METSICSLNCMIFYRGLRNVTLHRYTGFMGTERRSITEMCDSLWKPWNMNITNECNCTHILYFPYVSKFTYIASSPAQCLQTICLSYCYFQHCLAYHFFSLAAVFFSVMSVCWTIPVAFTYIVLLTLTFKDRLIVLNPQISVLLDRVQKNIQYCKPHCHQLKSGKGGEKVDPSFIRYCFTLKV